MTQGKNKKKQPQELKCSIEGCEFVTRKSEFAAQELGRHMKFAHGVAGKSSSALKAQKLKTENEETTTNGQKRSYTKREAIRDETPILIFIGKITAYCEAEAKRYGVSEEYFVRRCAELFFASQVREKHRA